MKRGTDCAVHRHSQTVPLEDHHVWPKEYGGPVKGEKARICPNAHSDVHYFIDLLLKHEGFVPREEGLTFGYKVQHLAKRGYAMMEEGLPPEEFRSYAQTAVVRVAARQREETEGDD